MRQRLPQHPQQPSKSASQPQSVVSELQPLRFVRRGDITTLSHIAPDRSLLEVLREDLGLTGTKEGCGEGDCGACTVVVAEAHGDELRYRAINSCIKPAHAIDGMALWTVQDIESPSARSTPDSRCGNDSGTLHPAQAAMVQCHASQCGFCTPGFVMSLFALYQSRVCKGEVITRDMAQQALSGNLCRCTGYRPILDAAVCMSALPSPSVNEADLLHKLRRIAPVQRGGDATRAYSTPRTLATLLRERAANPGAQLVAGCTDVGLWITKQHRQFERVIDLTRVRELRRVERYRHHIAIGAAVTLQDAFAALVQDRPQLQPFADRFAGMPVRNAGTLGGNVANGSPIGDSMPLLIAMGASVVLMQDANGRIAHREIMLEDLYTGYRSNVMTPIEVLAWIKVPLPSTAPAIAAVAPLNQSDSAACATGCMMRVYKVSKRFEDDISAICLALEITVENGIVRRASIGVGGVAATPVRARKTEAILTHAPWATDSIARAVDTLRSEFAPISDMRASAAYRVHVLGSLLERFWRESLGETHTQLESFQLEAEAA